MKKVLDILKKHQGNFISGSEIGKELNISRMAVNKEICKLRAKGYSILSTTNRGYCLSEDNDTLELDALKSKLKNPHSIEIFKRIDSTNNYIKENIKNIPFNHIVISNEQTNGRGRQSRKFFSTKDKGIYMSFFIKPNCSIEESLKLTILTSVAVFSAIKKNYSVDIKLKWVNDLILNNLKIGGILCEGEIELNNKELNSMIIGIGINVKSMEFPPELCDIATSIENHTDTKIQRINLIADIVNYFDLYFGGQEDYMKIYRDNSLLKNTPITVYQNNQSYDAIAVDVDDFGSLIIEKDNKISKLNSGEISVRKIDF